MAVRGRAAAAHRESPRDLAHIEVVLRIQGETMRRGETSGCRHFGRAPARQDFARFVEDAHARVARYLDRTEALRDVALVPCEFGHVSAAERIEGEMRRPL